MQSEARVQAWLGSGQSSLPALQKAAFSLCPHMAKREREREQFEESFVFVVVWFCSSAFFFPP